MLGVFRMLVDTPVTMGLQGFENGYTPGSFLWIVNNINFQYFSVLITIVSAVVMVVVSYATRRPEYEKIAGLTFATATAADRRRPAQAGIGAKWRPRRWSWPASSGPTCISADNIRPFRPGRSIDWWHAPTTKGSGRFF